MIVANLPEIHIGRIQRRKQRYGIQFRLNSHIDDYNISNVMLDFGFGIKILPRKTWEAMGKPKLVYSPIQSSPWPIGIVSMLLGVYKEVDLACVKTLVDF
jgi:hypothetical protein